MNYGYYPNFQNNYNNYQQQMQQLQQLQQLQQMQSQPQAQTQIQQQSNVNQGFSIIPVSSIDEVKAKTVDWSGKTDYFIDNLNKKVYAKYLDINGIPKIDIYALDSSNDNTNTEYATKEEVNNLKAVIDDLLKNLGGATNEQ